LLKAIPAGRKRVERKKERERRGRGRKRK